MGRSKTLQCPLIPLGDYYAVVPDDAPTHAGNIVLNAAYTNAPRAGRIAAWGPDTADLKNGDRVLWRPFAGTTVEIGDALWMLLREDDILCRLEP